MKHTPEQYQNTYTNRVKQFEQSQPHLNAGTQPKGKPSKAIPASIENPYLRARTEILTHYPDWKRAIIKENEENGTLDGHIYQDFVHEVAVLGDKY